MSPGERTFALLIRLYPREFRDRYREDLLAFFRQDREHARYGSGLMRPFRFWTATVRDLTRAAWSYRRTARREAVMSMPAGAGFARLRSDLRLAWRGLWTAPGVTLAALAVLIVGIGASTTIFSVVDAVVLRGLPYPRGDRLALVTIDYAKRPAPMLPPDYFDLHARQTSFEPVGASAGLPPLITVDEPVVTLTAVHASPPRSSRRWGSSRLAAAPLRSVMNVRMHHPSRSSATHCGEAASVPIHQPSDARLRSRQAR